MSTATIAFVRGVISRRTLSGSRQNVSASMSAKTGMAPLTSAQTAEADIVYGLQITSSPGPTPTAVAAALSALVAEFIAIACLAPTRAAQVSSRLRTRGPP